MWQVFVKAVRELGEAEGSSLRAVEKFVGSEYEIEVEQVRQGEEEEGGGQLGNTSNSARSVHFLIYFAWPQRKLSAEVRPIVPYDFHHLALRIFLWNSLYSV